MVAETARARPIFKCVIALLLPLPIVIACSGHRPSGEAVAHTSQHIWNGKPLPLLPGETHAQSTARHGVVKISWSEKDSNGLTHSHTGSSAVLSPSWLLTAAHVITNKATRGISDSVLAHISGSAVTIPKSDIYVHPRYNVTLGPHLSPFDVALLHVPSGGLTALGVSSTFLRPISATLPTDFGGAGMTARCIGYGPLQPGAAQPVYPHYADFKLFHPAASGFLRAYRGPLQPVSGDCAVIGPVPLRGSTSAASRG